MCTVHVLQFGWPGFSLQFICTALLSDSDHDSLSQPIFVSDVLVHSRMLICLDLRDSLDYLKLVIIALTYGPFHMTRSVHSTAFHAVSLTTISSTAICKMQSSIVKSFCRFSPKVPPVIVVLRDHGGEWCSIKINRFPWRWINHKFIT